MIHTDPSETPIIGTVVSTTAGSHRDFDGRRALIEVSLGGRKPFDIPVDPAIVDRLVPGDQVAILVVRIVPEEDSGPVNMMAAEAAPALTRSAALAEAADSLRCAAGDPTTTARAWMDLADRLEVGRG